MPHTWEAVLKPSSTLAWLHQTTVCLKYGSWVSTLPVPVGVHSRILLPELPTFVSRVDRDVIRSNRAIAPVTLLEPSWTGSGIEI